MARFNIYLDSARQWRWRLVASNGAIIASSGEAFASRFNAIRAASLVKHYAANADVED